MSEFGFKSETVKVETSDGWHCRLIEDLAYTCKDGRTLRVPAGSETDGLSTPKIIWNLIPPFGKPWLSGILHDSAYRGTLEIQTPVGHWLPVPLGYADEEFCDMLIKEAMESQGVSRIEVETIYLALKKCGWRAFSDDRKKP